MCKIDSRGKTIKVKVTQTQR